MAAPAITAAGAAKVASDNPIPTVIIIGGVAVIFYFTVGRTLIKGADAAIDTYTDVRAAGKRAVQVGRDVATFQPGPYLYGKAKDLFGRVF